MAREVVSIFDINQFGGVFSKTRCGPASVALMASANVAGKPPLHNPDWAVNEMHNLYQTNIGPNIQTNWDGTDMPTLYTMLQEEGLHWQNLFPDGPVDTSEFNGQLQGYVKASMREFLRRGYAVIIACVEDSVIDMELGYKPYWWETGVFNHIFTITGIADNGIDFLVRDPANTDQVTGLRPGPRVYAATQLNLISATVVGLASQIRPSVSNEGHPTMQSSNAPHGPAVPGPEFSPELLFYWNYTKLNLPYTTGIGHSWAKAYHQDGKHFGPPLGPEGTVEGVGVIQVFAHAHCIWQKDENGNFVGVWFSTNGWEGNY